MSGKSPRRSPRSSRKARKGSAADQAARLRRALARERARRRALEAKLGADTTRQQETAASLDAAREQQAVTAEILRLVSSSPGDAQPVFDAIARHAVRLCAGRGAFVVRYDGAVLHVAAHHNVSPEAVDRMESYFPVAPDPNTLFGKTVLDGGVVHVPDIPC